MRIHFCIAASLLLISQSIAQENKYDDLEQTQRRANDILNQSLGSVDECYRGVTDTNNKPLADRTVGAAFNAAIKRAAEPGGACEMYLQMQKTMPLDISVPIVPGVSVKLETLCQIIKQKPKCAQR